MHLLKKLRFITRFMIVKIGEKVKNANLYRMIEEEFKSFALKYVDSKVRQIKRVFHIKDRQPI
jgi:hypothetical protein